MMKNGMRTVIHRTARLLSGLALLGGILLMMSVPTQGQTVSFTGTWKTIAGGTHPYTVILKQVGNKVTGSYSPGNGKIFDGVVTGNKLTFKWSQDGGYEGTGEFTMNKDGKGFTGTSTALKPKEFTNTWNTYEPEPASFAGTWETISDGQNSVPLTIVQKGNKVTGLYPSANGKLEGTVSGRVLRFKWESDNGSGSGRFVMDESNFAFSGTYNRGDNPDEVEATWNGKHAGSSGGKLPGNRSDSPVSFAGEWVYAMGNSRPMRTILAQAGNQVTGKLIFGFTPLSLIEATVVGNTLRFKLKRDGGSVSGSGEFVMDAGGKSFRGSINGEPVTGAFVRPAQP